MSNMVVNTNVLAINSRRSLKSVGTAQARASSRLSSGLRINSAADDAAGLAISEKMRAQIRGLDQASTNAQDAISLIQTAEGGMQEVDNMLQRIRELTVQASNDTNDQPSGDRTKIQEEINQLTIEIDNMAERVEFNKKKVINGNYANKTPIPAELKTLAELETIRDNAASQMSNAAASELSYADSLASAQASALDADKSLASVANSLQSLMGGASGYTALNAAKETFDISYAELNARVNELIGLHEADVTNVAVIGSMNAAIASRDNYVVASSGMNNSYQSVVASYYNYIDSIAGYINLGDTAKIRQQSLSAGLEAASNAYDVAQKTYRDTLKQIANLDAPPGAAPTDPTQTLYFQVGANAYQGLALNIGSVKSDNLGIGDGHGVSDILVDQSTGANITGLLDRLDNALSIVTGERAKLGAAQNRLEYTIKSLDISSENLVAAESRIRDADMAKEMMNLTKSNVLQQAAISMLAQANQAPQAVLQLLQ